MANCISTASRNITTKNNVCGPQKRFLLCSFIKTLDYSIVLTLLDDVSWLYFVFFDSLSCALHNDVMSAIKGWCSRTISQPFWCKNFSFSKSSFFFSSSDNLNYSFWFLGGRVDPLDMKFWTQYLLGFRKKKIPKEFEKWFKISVIQWWELLHFSLPRKAMNFWHRKLHF